MLISCTKSDSDSKTGQSAYPKDVSITYRITRTTGTGSIVNLSYTNASGGDTNVASSTIQFTATVNRSVAYNNVISLGTSITAGTGTTTILTEILVDNVVVKSQTDSGTNSFSIAVVYQFL